MANNRVETGAANRYTGPTFWKTGSRRRLADREKPGRTHMDMMADPLASLKRLKTWCVDETLPWWAETGFDRASGTFHERLDLDGAPAVAAPRRTFVQARQIHVFADAAKRGWFAPGAELAVEAADRMIARNWAPDARPGWVFSLAPDGAPADPARPAYTQAFALFGLASAYDLCGDPRFLAKARETVDFLDMHLTVPGLPGYRSDDGADAGTRLQNPHMHLLEAFLAWYEITREEVFIDKARDMVALFATCLFERWPGIVPETFGPDWKPVADGGALTWEPGHSLEWVWLLRSHARLSGDPVDPFVDALLDTALRSGMSGGLFVNRLRDDGTVVDAGARVWPQTEALKAFAVEHEAGRPGMHSIACDLAATLRERFLGGRFPAGWRDTLGPDGTLAIDFVPASTLYHITLATAEIDRVFLAGKQDGAPE